LPLSFYIAIFGVHFTCLVNPGDGDGFMSSEFQATLNTKQMKDVPADVAIGARVSIRHWNTQGGYLHSHAHMYPEGSKQQQITLYPHKDENNLFLIENQTQPMGPDEAEIPGHLAWDNLPIQWVEDGATIRLYHLTTHKRVHSHDVRPPITEADWQNEVSGYGYEGFAGDANDLFRVEIVKHMSHGEQAKKRLRTIQTKFRLVHFMTGCVLFSHKVKLPDWAYEQQEVTCAKGGSLPNSIWYIETNHHPQLGPNAEKVNYRRPGFFGKFWELHKVMWRTNAGLTDSHAWDSRPSSWPTLLRGINFWSKQHRQVYLLGNPVIWWTSTVAIVTYVFFKAIAILRWQRSCGDYSNVTFKRFDYEIGQTVLGWALHYFPFFLMARQLFLHHYFPSLYFAIICFCQMYDFGANRISVLGLSSKKAIFGKIFMVFFLVLSIASFLLYSPLVYGNPWTKSACRQVKLLSSWDFDCNTFYPTVSDPIPSIPTWQAPRRGS
jgi:dolichyl-phosphate-mannose-protein mannosyltransferase